MSNAPDSAVTASVPSVCGASETVPLARIACQSGREEVPVVDGSGLTARHRTAVTLNGDAADGVLAEVAWSRPDTLLLTTGEGEVTTVRLDPNPREAGARAVRPVGPEAPPTRAVRYPGSLTTR
jgi:hypothetical protein